MSGCSDDAAVSKDESNEVGLSTSIEQEEIKVRENQEEENQKNQELESQNPDNKAVEGNIEVHFIDVGQGDSILIKQNDNSMLIDAGENGYGDAVVRYLENLGVSSLDYVIGTHPHSDHIGGLDDVINSFDIGKVIMPKVSHTTKTFEDVVMSVKNKGMKITTPVVGDKYKLGDAEFTIIGPNSSSYNNLNDYSVGLRLVFSENSFIFTGDAERQAEVEMVANGLSLKADMLKLGHHGSSTSTTQAFIDKVDPDYAVAQVGEGNRYNHPDRGVLNKLKGKGIRVFRNDLNGNIVFTGDGEKLTVSTGKDIAESESNVYVSEEKQENKEEGEGKYIGNKNSKVLHISTCSSLPAEHNRIYFSSKEDALESGYRPCGRCKP